ncbi:MAG: YodL domain-containing protein [Erysipelotrichales bacterium]|nr:YodL domain-containing protein [Erysipelotrichales bacterium]
MKKDLKIYQLPAGCKTKFRSFKKTISESKDKMIDFSDYNIVYEKSDYCFNSLDDIYTKFNVNHPSDFKGHSLSISDIVQIGDEWHFVDSIGFNKLDESHIKKMFCTRCSSIVFKSENQAYSFQCLTCDEDLYSLEVKEKI